MLVLSRKEGERICIGDQIEVNVIAVRGKRVKLAFVAPEHVPIRRAELLGPAMASSIVSSLLHTRPKPRAELKLPR